MGFKDLFKAFKREVKNVPSALQINIYKEEAEKPNTSPSDKEVPKQVIQSAPTVKVTADLYYMRTPIADYKYKEVRLTLYEQRDFYREEKEKLLRISDNINVYKQYYNKISKIAPLAKSADYNKLPHLRGLQLNATIPVLKNDLGILINEYERAVKGAAKQSYNAKVGIYGENSVDRELDLYRDKLLNLSNIRLIVESNTVESDNLVISERGIFCIEVKNFGVGRRGKIKVSKDGLWSRLSAEGDVMEVNDVTSQTYRHIGLTQRLLNEELKRQGVNLPYININPIIVFVNPAIKIDNQSDVPVLRLSNIYHHISTFKTDTRIDEKYWGVIENILNAHNQGAKPYPVKLCADKIIQNYMEVYNKLRYFDCIDKQVNLEKILQQAVFIGNDRLISCFEKYSSDDKESRKVSHLEIISLRALIDELDIKGKGDRGMYEGLILKYFNVDNLSDLKLEAYEYIYQALNKEIRRK
ncbi:nuclease-related domain-containing protein [Clostridium magnum]|uniref:nuclease-related domain-containing protein n=1 Tax=Clostridium magnum TaxID=33954 RepID=UPI0008340710|nr:nuclease-related domain-containing protein [Clostridium magnum]